jgi:uncharacterized protein with PIN domain
MVVDELKDTAAAKMAEIKVCPTCESDRIRNVCRAVTRSATGRDYKVVDPEFYECPNCGERLYDAEDASSPAIPKNTARRRTA